MLISTFTNSIENYFSMYDKSILNKLYDLNHKN